MSVLHCHVGDAIWIGHETRLVIAGIQADGAVQVAVVAPGDVRVAHRPAVPADEIDGSVVARHDGDEHQATEKSDRKDLS